MGIYDYIAKTAAGDEVSGRMQADSEAAVVHTLDEKNLYPVSITSGRAATGLRLGRGIRDSAVGVFYGELGDLLRAGVPMIRALDTIGGALGEGPLKDEVLRIRERVAEGDDLSDAFEERPEVFAPAHAAMVRAGERGGFLEDVLRSLADFIERQDELRSKVRGAMAYPVLLLGLLTAAVLFCLIWLVPRFMDFLADAPKPLPTRVVFGASNLVRHQWPLMLLGGVLLGGVGYVLARSEAFGRAWDKIRVRIPVFGEAVRMVSVTRFCRILGTMLQAGVPLLEALKISKDASGSPILAERLDEAVENVRAGESLAEPLRASGMIPASIIEMIAVAEESNQLETVLLRIADTVERRTNRKVDMAVRLVEPLILVLIAGTIGFVVLGLYYPIFSMAGSLE